MLEHEGLPSGATARAKGLRRRMTVSEQRLWRERRKPDLNFRRQAPIGRFVTDCASHGRRLVIEVDLPQLRYRDEITVETSKSSDWTYTKGGKQYGGFTIRAMLSGANPEERREIEAALAPTPLEPEQH
jgi:hypothetical protein